MAANITITEDEILNANTYIPNADKEEITRALAVFCIEEAPREGAAKAVPPLYRERRYLKNQIITGIFAELYLKRNIMHQSITLRTKNGGNTEARFISGCMAQDEYDKWAGSHVFNQLERLKTSRKQGVRDKIYDILQDLRMFENMLNGAIRDELAVKNDTGGRLMSLLSGEITPELFQKLAEEMPDLQQELNELAEIRKE